MFIVIFFIMGDLFGLIFLVFLIPIDIYAFVYSPGKEKEFELQKAEFLNRISDTRSLKEEKILELYCPECGKKLEPYISVCSYCGSLIKDLSDH